MELSLDGLCKELRFTAATFQDVTGVSVPIAVSDGKVPDVIPFPKMA